MSPPRGGDIPGHGGPRAYDALLLDNRARDGGHPGQTGRSRSAVASGELY